MPKAALQTGIALALIASSAQSFAADKPKQQQFAGVAAYYDTNYHGRTAAGEPYDPHKFTAAHRTLPFGTVLRVTRVGSGQRVYVRVTDRGPYGPRGRILDLSRAAAEHLGMLRAGVAKIEVEVVEYGPRKSRRRRR